MCAPQAPQILVFCLLLGSEEHTSELQSPQNLVCRLLLEIGSKLVSASVISESPTPSYASTPVYIDRVLFRTPFEPALLTLALHQFPLFFFKERGPPDISPLSPDRRFPV